MTPLARATLLFAAGVLAGLRFTGGGGLPGVLSALSAAVCAALLLRRIAGGTAFFVFGMLGLSAGAGGAFDVREDCRARFTDGDVLRVVGAFESVIVDGAASFHAVAAGGTGSLRSCAGALRVRVPAPVPAPLPGTEVILTGRWWSSPAASRWPTPPERSGVLGVRAITPVQPARRHPLIALRVRSQSTIHTLFPGTSAFAEALVLARREGLAPEVRQRFAESGLTHLLAISGTHVGLLAGVLVMLARMLRLSATPAGIVAAGGTLAYVLFLGAPNAAARAAIQVLLLLAARLNQRPSDPFTLLAFAALLILAADPLAALDAGFQLSFAGIFGILAMRRPLLGLLPARLPRAVADGLATSLAATAATTPIAALHFGQVAPVGIVVNLIAIPLVGLCVPAVALALVVNPLSAGAANFLAEGAAQLLRALDACARAAAAVPGGHAFVSPGVVFAWLVAAGVVIVVNRNWPAGAVAITPGAARGGSGRAPRVMLVHVARGGALAVLVASGWPLVAGHRGGALEIHAIDVGQGDALAVRTPGGQWIVIDTGPRTQSFDAGRSRVVPFLLRHDARRLAALILTHPDGDHIGGAQAILDVFDVDVVIDPGTAVGKGQYVATLDAARLHNTRWLAARAGRELRVDDLVIRFLAPDEQVLDSQRDANDFSVVFRLGYGRFGALFLGDAPAWVEDRIVARDGPSIASEVIKVGHHGSRTSTGDSLLNAVSARLALISVGRKNRYGHPAPDVIERLNRHGIRIVRTDESGSITVRVNADGRMTLTTAR